MRRRRMLISAVAAAMLTTSALGAPAAAVELPQAVIVHGIPGVNVDLCVNGNEIRSGFRYGQKAKTDIPPGQTKVVLKPRRNGTCTGDTIAKVKINGDSTAGVTIVARLMKGKPALQIMRDAGPSVAAYESLAFVANGSSFGTVDAWISTGIVLTAPSPTYPGLKRGQRRGVFLQSEITVAAWFSRPGKTRSLLLPAVQQSVLDKHHHFVLIGTKAKNLRTVKFQTEFSPT